jgi:phage FluMu gp28-like protein
MTPQPHPLAPAAHSVAAAQDQGPPAVLLPYQQDWLADDAQLKICEKGRRVGLTWAEAADAVLIACAEGGSNYFYISATQDMAREFIEACGMWARAFDYLAGEVAEGFYDDGDDIADPAKRFIKTYELNFPKTGRRIVALSSRPTNLRGKQGVIGIDEAAFAPELAGLIKAAMAMLLWGDKVRIWSTHDGVENPFAQLAEEVRAGKRGASATVHRVSFADAVADGLYKRVCLRRSRAWSPEAEAAWVAQAYAFYGDDAAEELDCIPSSSAGKYLSLALISERMAPTWSPANPTGPALVRGRWDDAFAYLSEDVRQYAIKGWINEQIAPHLARLSPLHRHVFGQDFARSTDLSVITVLEEETDLVHRVKLVIELSNCPFSCQEQILFAVVDALKTRRFRGGAMDATGNGAALAEKAAQRYGVEMVEQVKLSAAWYLAHMPKLKAGLQDGTLTNIPRDEPIQGDLRAIALVQGVPMVPRVNTASAGARAAAAEGGEGKSGRRHGDFAISLLMAEYAFHREAGETDWTPAPAGGRRWDGAAPARAALSGPPRDDDDDAAHSLAASDGGAW